MDFGDAIRSLKRGYKVSREGWNGKGMWLIYVPGTPAAALKADSPYFVALNSNQPRDAVDTTHCEILPHIDMWTTNAQGRRAMLPGWLASQTDMLADDWEVVA